MSLLQKFTKLFKSKDEMLESLGILLKPKSQKNFDVACEYFGLLMKRYPTVVFNLLRSKENVENYQPKAEYLLNLLFVIHANIFDDSVCAQLRGSPIYWLDKLMNQNKESFILIERMIYEVSTSSFFPQQSPLTQPSQFQGKEEQIKEKRKTRIEMNEQLKNPVQKTENQLVLCKLKVKIFCIIYYSFLQKLQINQLVYQSCKDLQYPFEEPEDVKLRYIWIYKIQNVMLMGLKLLEWKNIKYKIYQDLVYWDLVRFQIFVRQEIEQLIDYIYMRYFQNFREPEQQQRIIIMKQIQNQELIEEFLNFSVRIKVLNQFAFKKSIKVPNRLQPNISILQSSQSDHRHHKAVSDINKENVQPLNCQDLEFEQIYERGVMERKFYNQSTENSMDEIGENIQLDVKQYRPQDVKGLSTFQQY